MRNMSFMLTTAQVRAQTKTVTRRIGWSRAKVGDVVQPVEKGQGLKKGEHVVKLGPPIRIVAVWREELRDISPADVRREGFPEMTREEFIAMLTRHNRCEPQTIVTRIEFEYTAPPEVAL